jgi:hypothetical protein
MVGRLVCRYVCDRRAHSSQQYVCLESSSSTLLTVPSRIDILDAIQAAHDAITAEHENPDTPNVQGYDGIIDILVAMVEETANLELPEDTSMPSPGNKKASIPQKQNEVAVAARGLQETTG